MSRLRAIVVAPLPPPDGGVAHWTRRLLANGVPGWRITLVDTRIRSGRAVFDQVRRRDELTRTVRVLWGLAKGLAFERPDIVYATSSMAEFGVFRDLACATLACLARRPLIVHYRGNVANFRPEGYHGLTGWALRRLAHLAACNLVLWPGAVAELSVYAGADIPQTTEIMPTFVDDDWPDRIALQRTEHGRLRILYVGGLAEQKGVLELLEVAARCPEYDFILVGWQTEHLRLRLESAPPNCIFCGARSPDEVAGDLSSADIFFLPSWTEGCPNVILEAMAAGLPVVASAVGAIPDLVPEGLGGLLRQPRDVEGFVKAIQTLGSDARLRRQFGQRNRAACDVFYRASVVLAKMADLWTRTADRVNRPHPSRRCGSLPVPPS